MCERIKAKTIAAVVGVIAAAAVCGGCSDSRPIYQAPALAAEDTVTLKGERAVFVDAIDDQRIDGAQIYSTGGFGPPSGGNEVTTSAGTHKVLLNLYGGGQFFNSKSQQTVTQQFVGGHTYKFTMTANVFAPKLRVIDVDGNSDPK